MKINRKTEIILVKRGKTTLSPANYLSSGGEASVYKKGKTIIKLYTDQPRIIRDNLPDKIAKLSQLQHPFIVSPQNMVLDKTGKPIGYYMPLVNGEALSRFFTNDFRNQIGFGIDETNDLVEKMQETVKFAHKRQAVMVDANELNWLVLKQQNYQPRIIDVDSWAIDRWRAQVVMPSIRDWHTKGFNQKSDWFSWGVVTFQLYTGIHPYKGKLSGYKPTEMIKRMKENASVFSRSIRLNRAVRDFSLIPSALLNWYKETFQKGKRSIPPAPSKNIITPKVPRKMRIVQSAQDLLIFDKLYFGANKVVKVFPCGLLRTDNNKLISIRKGLLLDDFSEKGEVIYLNGGFLCADQKDKKFSFVFIKEKNKEKIKLDINLNIKQLFRFENRLFVVGEQGLSEVFLKFFSKPLLCLGQRQGILRNSSQWLEGVGVQDALGAKYIIAPFGVKSCAQIRAPELDNLKIINGQAGTGFACFIGVDKKGFYHKLEFAFDKNYQSCQVWRNTTDNPVLNIAILENGLCATIVQDKELVIFAPHQGLVKKIPHPNIGTDMTLAKINNKVVYFLDNEIWQIRTK